MDRRRHSCVSREGCRGLLCVPRYQFKSSTPLSIAREKLRLKQRVALGVEHCARKSAAAL